MGVTIISGLFSLVGLIVFMANRGNRNHILRNGETKKNASCKLV